ncbi:MAG: hypothetical protein ABEK84_01395 [Salinibacter sp.]
MTVRQRSILVGAVVTGILSTSYLFFINVLCCLGVIVGGAVATQQYTSRTRSTIESGDGAVLGALAGVGGTVLQFLFNWALRPFGLGIRDIALKFAKQMQGQRGMSQQMMEQAQTSPGLGAILFNLIVGMVVYAIFGAIGGAIGAAMFGNEEAPDGTGGIQTAEAEIIDDPEGASDPQSKRDGSD